MHQNDELRDSSTNTDSDRVLVTKRAIFQALRDCIYETNEEYVRECWEAKHGTGSIDADTLLRLQFAAAGMSKVVELWVLNGCKESLEAVSDAILESTPSSILNTLY